MKTSVDVVFKKQIYMNGKQLSGVQSVTLKYDTIETVTKVIVEFIPKKNSVKIHDNKISFETVGGKK